MGNIRYKKIIACILAALLITGIMPHSFVTAYAESTDTGLDELNSSRANALVRDDGGENGEEVSENNAFFEDIIPENGYNALDHDAFLSARSFKGVQGRISNGCGHYFMNLFITDFAGPSPWEYEGKTYYFKSYAPMVNTVKSLNAKGITVSYEILLESTGRLCEPAARSGSGASSYYQINVSEPEIKKEWEAFFDYLAYHFSMNDCHIDNWILGNEVSMPREWNWGGSYDPDTIVNKYSESYMMLYKAVKRYTDKSRVSVCLGNTWNHTDNGKGVGTRDFLNKFDERVKAINGGPVIWCLSFHPYPAVMYETNIWGSSALAGRKLNPNTEDAEFVDAANLRIMTEYIKNHFGSEHRIMMTEMGSSAYMGQENQAACLAYTYYASKYNDMVDCFIYFDSSPEPPKLDFTLEGRAVKDVWEKIDEGNEADEVWIASYCLPVIGASNWGELIYGYNNEALVEGFVRRLYRQCLNREPDEEGLRYWKEKLVSKKITGANAGAGFFDSDEFKNSGLSDEDYVETLYKVMMGRASDNEGKAYWVKKLKEGVGRQGVYSGFAGSTEFKNICNSYGIDRGSYTPSEGRSKNPGLTQFIYRMYSKALNREAEVNGLNYWCDAVLNGQYSLDDMATRGFFESAEFLSRNLSDEDFVETAYNTFFDRPSDEAGKADWLNRMRNLGYTRMDVIRGFCGSEEFGNLKASFGL
ncbi:MAG TPA: hypothetical protein DCG85_01075 [Lachnospiraceae bacterium]|nr:hypothetical protein [Lachnospiraceae bacterium]